MSKKLDEILHSHLIAYERTDGTGQTIDNIESAKADIKALMLELIGEDYPYGSEEHYRVAQNKLKAELRQKVEAL